MQKYKLKIGDKFYDIIINKWEDMCHLRSNLNEEIIFNNKTKEIILERTGYIDELSK